MTSSPALTHRKRKDPSTVESLGTFSCGPMIPFVLENFEESTYILEDDTIEKDVSLNVFTFMKLILYKHFLCVYVICRQGEREGI